MTDDNVATLLEIAARDFPDRLAIAEPMGRDPQGKRIYRQVTMRELDDDSSLLANGLQSLGARPGMRLALLVPQGIDFITWVFAMFKAGVVIILIDPGMGRRSMIGCLSEAQPEGVIGIGRAQVVRSLLRHRFPQARLNVTVGRRWFWGGATVEQLRARTHDKRALPDRSAEDPAAIIFTTGSTGPPKGVLYQHRNFVHQAREIQRFYQIQPGEVDLPAFPLFALFNCAMGVSTVIPDMDPTRPANVDPAQIVEAIRDWDVTQSFGSPALWNVVGRHCESRGIQLPTLRRVLSAGAPVPVHVLERMKNAIHPEGDVFTPYGATEALPVASIAASEVLADTAAESAKGRGTCVGKPFPEIQWKVIAIDDRPIAKIDQIVELPVGEIGELMVHGPVVTQRYLTRTEANALHKVSDGDVFWHRMGDVGYLDEHNRFWFCGRKSHRVRTEQGTMFTIPCEAIVNQHPDVYRSALVPIGEPGRQIPVIIVEPWPERRPRGQTAQQRLLDQVREIAAQHELTRQVKQFLVHPAFPVDIRHNAKIFREKLAVWAEKMVNRGP